MIAEQYRKMLDAKSVIRQLSEKATKRAKFAQSWVCAAAQSKPARARTVKNSFFIVSVAIE